MGGHRGSALARERAWVRRVRERLQAFVHEHTPTGRAERTKVEDDIDEAGRESFPASDPPSWTLGSDHNKHP